MNLTPENALSHAPDDASKGNARALANPAKWKSIGAFDSDEGEVAWGEITGSGGGVYHTRVEIDEPAFRCTCPSRKLPCKHSLALLLLRAKDPGAFKAPPPEWALDEVADVDVQGLELPASWQNALGDETRKSYFKELETFVSKERHKNTVYPPVGQEFAALDAVAPADVKVFILGQDPYHGPGQAHGMAFSVRPGVAPPPSLGNIFRELRDDLDIPMPHNGYLMGWADQGVLLLNAVLTVRRSEANSHKSQGWEKFTDAVIRAISAGDEPVVFVLWGNYAQKKEKLIDADKHTTIKSAHPSPLSAHNGFFGSKPFSQINDALEKSGRTPIDWARFEDE